MNAVNMLEAKSTLSRLVEAIETGKEREVIIARHGRPVAKLVPIEVQPVQRRIGIARGLFEIGDDIDQHNDQVAALFLGQSV